MDNVIANFVGLLGPGQIIDRKSLVLLPTGFVKIAIYNSRDVLLVYVSEFKESLNRPSIKIRMHTKAYLTVGDGVYSGGIVSSELLSDSFLDSSLRVLKFDKRCVSAPEKISQNKVSEEEILQLCLYACAGRQKKSRFLGLVHIAISKVQQTSSYNVEAWYKVFPQTAFIIGFPIVSTFRHCVDPSVLVETPVSHGPEFLESVSTTIVQNQHPTLLSPSSSSSSSTPGSMYWRRRNSFHRVARVLSRIMQKKGEERCDGDKEAETPEKSSPPSLASSSSSDGLIILSQEQSSINSLNKPMKDPSSSIRKTRSAGSKLNFEKVVKLTRRLNFSRSRKPLSTIKRSEEVICIPELDSWSHSQWQTTDYQSEDRLSVHQSSYEEEKIEKKYNYNSTKTMLKFTGKQNSIETADSEELSSVELDDASQRSAHERLNQNIRTATKIISWVKSSQMKTKHQSLPTTSSPKARRLKKLRSFRSYTAALKSYTEEDDLHSRQTYEVLKLLQNSSKDSPKVEKEAKSSRLQKMSNVSSDDVTSHVDDNPVQIRAEVTTHSIADSVFHNVKDTPEQNSRKSTCLEKREKFAMRRRSATDLSPAVQQTNCCEAESPLRMAQIRLSLNGLDINSDDDYLTCSEGASSCNLSTVSNYTTASER